jgi:hypothetical protein
MLTVTYQHHGWGIDGDHNPPDCLQLPISISQAEIEIMRSDCCETIIQPSLTGNDMAVLRRALTEWGHEDWLGLEETVLDCHGEVMA